ncbi:MAG: hypothetical protein NZ651_06915 [Candidatus Bipolaricaulota bacterium]|nr:hypothetical protein [Candidatus Bipolaricaulota bacterium]MDW8127484.1 hypothetical protein [Candidatus Bipolaricaulota bacterium]
MGQGALAAVYLALVGLVWTVLALTLAFRSITQRDVQMPMVLGGAVTAAI